MAHEDREYCAWLLRTQPCVFCEGSRPTEIHHHTSGSTVAPGARPTGKQLGGKRGKSQRAHDHFGMPAHIRCHAKFHTECAESGDDRRAWQDAQVERLRAAYEEYVAVVGAPGSAVPGPDAARPIAPVPGKHDDFTIDSLADSFVHAYPMIGENGRLDFVRAVKRAVGAALEGKRL